MKVKIFAGAVLFGSFFVACTSKAQDLKLSKDEQLEIYVAREEATAANNKLNAAVDKERKAADAANNKLGAAVEKIRKAHKCEQCFFTDNLGALVKPPLAPVAGSEKKAEAPKK